MLTLLNKVINRKPWLVFLLGITLLGLGGVYGIGVFDNLKSGGFEDPDSESARAITELQQKMGYHPWNIVVLFTAKNAEKVDDPAFHQAVEASLNRVKGQPGVAGILTYYSTGATQLVSKDHHSTYAVVSLQGVEEDQPAQVARLRPLLTSDQLLVRLGGSSTITQEIGDQVGEDIATAESITFPILAVLLVLVFGNYVAALLPLGIGGLSILGAFFVMKVASHFMGVSIFAVNVITMLGLGLAIDYSLFIVTRFREEIAKPGATRHSALARTMQTAGRTVMFSGLTVTISLLSLTIFPQMFLKSMGLGGAAAVLVAMLNSIIILPAALALFGHHLDKFTIRWGRKRQQSRPVQAGTVDEAGFWYRASHLVMRRPGLILVGTLALLIWAGLPFLRAEFSIPDARSLPSTSQSRVVGDLLQTQFPPNETQPILALVNSRTNSLDPAALTDLYNYTRQVQTLPGVQRVDSLVTLDPKLDLNAYLTLYSPESLKSNPEAAQAVQQYTRNNYNLVSVIYKGDPVSASAQQLVQNLRALKLPTGMTTLVGGSPAELVDYLSGIVKMAPWAFGLIVSVIFSLLFLMLGSLVVPLKAVILNIFSLLASFGALVWVFQDGNLAQVFGFQPMGNIDGIQPILIFAIAFGLSMDYEVFLLSRIKEQYDRTGDTAQAVAWGIQKSARVITCAAFLLVVVIGAFATGKVIFIKQIGVGLGLAILIDAFIVRLLLVPATMCLMGKYNWWAPRPLVALYNRLGLGEVEAEETPVIATGEAARTTPEPTVGEPAQEEPTYAEAASS